MRVHMSLFFWFFLALVVAWREASKRVSIQDKVHKLGPLAFILQWYTLFFIGYGILLAWSIYELWGYYMFLGPEEVSSNLRKIWDEKYGHMDQNAESFIDWDNFEKKLLIRPWMRVVGVTGVVCGILTYFVLLVHIMKYAFDCRGNPNHEVTGSKYSFGVWRPPIRMNMVMLILVNPGVYSVMSLRALCRIWTLVTGQVNDPHHQPWPQLKTVEHALFTGDMELAMAFQFLSVYCFAQLCGNYLANSSIIEAYESIIVGASEERQQEFHQNASEYKRTIKWAAFLCVYAFVIVGVCRSFLDFILCEVRVYEQYEEPAEEMQNAVAAKLGVVFQALTLLVVINMKLICDMKDITKKLAQANLMFLATRILLLIGDNQDTVISAFTVNSALFKQFQNKTASLAFVNDLPEWTFTDHQAHLFNLSLVNIECLIVVIINVVAWRNLDIEKSEIMSLKPLLYVVPDEPNKSAETKGLLAASE